MVRGEYDQALAFVSEQALGCVGSASDLEGDIKNRSDAVRELRRIMKEIHDYLNGPENPGEAIRGREPWQKDIYQVIDHPYRQFFAAFSVPDENAQRYLCQPVAGQSNAVEEARSQTEAGSYHATMFQFRFGEDGGTLALLWAREAGRWMIVSWATERQ